MNRQVDDRKASVSEGDAGVRIAPDVVIIRATVANRRRHDRRYRRRLFCAPQSRIFQEPDETTHQIRWSMAVPARLIGIRQMSMALRSRVIMLDEA